MVHSRPQLPSGHGEVLAQPPVSEWRRIVEANQAAADSWSFSIAGISARELRTLARSDALAVAGLFSTRLGVAVEASGDPSAPIIATGHQPDLYHPGVWVKDFMVDRVARSMGASAFDLVVDSDGFDSITVASPCFIPRVERCRHYLALGQADGCYAFAPVPSREDLMTFIESTRTSLSTLSAPAVLHHFSGFAEALMAAAEDADNLAELITFARRRYEAPAGTGYLELPMTLLARTEAFRRFLVGVILDCERFAGAYNDELREYRSVTKTRSAAQPVPDLDVDDWVEVPFWALQGGRRLAVRVRREEGVLCLLAPDGTVTVSLPEDPEAAVAALASSDTIFAPKALALSMFTRMFACDLFIHGVGGGRYDRVTDGIIRRYFGVEPPAYAVASMTLYLPLGAHVTTPEEVSAAKERLNRLDHNPDALLAEVDFDDAAERERALALAEEKSRLVAAIAHADADKKSLGMRIKSVNGELAALLAPLRESFTTELERLTVMQAASDILTDRTYPFCFWDPSEVADKVR